MPRHAKHDRNTDRVYSGEPTARFLVDWLNGKGTARLNGDRYFLDGKDANSVTEAKKRVLDLIGGLRNLQKLIDQAPRVLRQPERRPEISAAFKELNLALERYPSYPRLWLDANHRGWKLIESPFMDQDHFLGEAYAVQTAIELAQENRLQRIQSCACGLWYFARFSHQKFCSAKCRETFWESSEERKVQKRNRARDYYWLHKTTKVK